MTLSSPARERILVINHGALGDIVPAEGGGSPSLHRTGIDQRTNAQRLVARPLAALPVQTVLRAVLRTTATCSASAKAVTGTARAATADGRLQHVATP